MSTSPQTDLHSVFPLERRGDTFIVAPKGDTVGFSHSQVHSELNAVLTLIKERGGNLIVDLLNANYFGSEMIGLINNIGLQTREAGGRIALCNVSQDMVGILRVMNFDAMWEFFDSRSSALKQLSHETFLEKLAALKAVLLTLLAISVVGLALVFYPWPDHNKERYQLLSRLSSDVVEMRRRGGTHQEWSMFRTRVMERVEPVLEKLKKRSSDGDQAATEMLKAGRDCLIPLLQSDEPNAQQLERQLDEHMASASKYIKDLPAASE